MVITRPDASKIRAEDGRNIEKVNISTFINNLPAKKDTGAFSTENASGSTSQAANVMEALEYGSFLLLIDEDTSATNFMIRDARMQKLIAPDKEPITPFSSKVKPL
ncbi:ABC-ATPase domain-containing protein, partial [Planococcus sp. SIMBA_143]